LFLPPFVGRAQATGIITKGDRMMIDAVIYMGCGVFGGVALVALAALALDAIADAQAKGRKATEEAAWLEEVRQEEDGT
jgi:hypothetical protein